MFIRSERLFLRPGWPEDWEEVYKGINDEAVACNLAQAPWPYTPQAAREYASREQDRRCPHFLVTLPGASGTRLIGSVGLARISDEQAGGDSADGDAPVELGYWIARAHWGRGYATEAGRAALAIARTLGHRRIGALQFAENPASARVLKKLGFRPTRRVERYCQGRKASVPAQAWARELGAPSDCDGCDIDPLANMRAA